MNTRTGEVYDLSDEHGREKALKALSDGDPLISLSGDDLHDKEKMSELLDRAQRAYEQFIARNS